ncbi:endolytic transglycosylase MltG [Lysinibacter sp. HNR]|uniref:endolytic transglycosylase MltG n=1 Tax=Lysinibacter sp. HNR TaxID=3031408 RepID=UPI00243568EE|nr:endolytic transglycosylase MltG [Lysinibacter sp. HNR]WGD36295.1 endolytic transglycosylase MltG [Lysinibacter sp. HNR]
MGYKDPSGGSGFLSDDDGETKPLISRRELREQLLREQLAREAEARAVAEATARVQAEERKRAEALAGIQAETVPNAKKEESETLRASTGKTDFRSLTEESAAGILVQNAEKSDPPKTAFSPAGVQAEQTDNIFPPLKKYREKNKSMKRRVIISLTVVVALLAALGGGGFLLWQSFGDSLSGIFGQSGAEDYEGTGTGEVTIVIAEGDDGTAIARTLESNGVVRTAQAFIKHVQLQNPSPIFYPGSYKMAKEMSAAAALEALLHPDTKVVMRAVVPEGIRASQVYDIVSSATGIPAENFMRAAENWSAFGVPASAPNIEGWLFPATYEFTPDDSAEGILQKMVDRTIQSLNAANVPEADRERILTTASIIQAEARQEQDFEKVSRVIANRLELGMTLGMDSTAQYGLPEANGKVWTSDEQRSNANPWNTYNQAGLPVGPITNPGDHAINAALNPAPGDWTYFATVNLQTGETKFTNSSREHQVFVQELQAWCIATGSDAC